MCIVSHKFLVWFWFLFVRELLWCQQWRVINALHFSAAVSAGFVSMDHSGISPWHCPNLISQFWISVRSEPPGDGRVPKHCAIRNWVRWGFVRSIMSSMAAHPNFNRPLCSGRASPPIRITFRPPWLPQPVGRLGTAQKPGSKKCQIDCRCPVARLATNQPFHRPLLHATVPANKLWCACARY